MILEPPAGLGTVQSLAKAVHEGLQWSVDRETHFTFGGVSWEQYLEFDQELGAERRGSRLYWDNEQLEFMGTSLKHEELRVWIASLIQDFLITFKIAAYPHGQATMRLLAKAGAEPDESWCLGSQKEFPDIVLEIALTSGGLPKLDIYRHFRVPEVWFWRQKQLEIWQLGPGQTGYHGPFRQSGLLPKLDVPFLERCLSLPTWLEACQAFRQGLA